VAIVLVVLLLFVGYRVASVVGPGIGQLLGVAGSVGSSGAPPTIELQRTYVVQSGDTVGSIAAQFGVSPALILQRNHLAHPNLIYPGERLAIPTPYHPKATRLLVEATARKFNLDPSFADALAYQESGFDENVVSSTGAIGVMQVEPGTGALVARRLGQPLDLGVEQDNITAGVYWLSYLTRYYGGDERKAAAAYYEGQQNLADHGYLPGTALYVADVMSLKHSFGG